ncbi:glycoside hydrolase [candidate division KSB1 bacterium]|nr:glycoside hydrolase [candidate division KSB1 bacterium]
MSYAEKKYDDSRWMTIQAPGKWENQGFSEYDGYAWYRINVVIPASLKENGILLRLGKIDDVDMVFINGQFLQGRGVFPPHYQTAFNRDRQYLIPQNIIHFDKENVIAIRVYDEWGEGGLISGPVGIYSQTIIELRIDLSGFWPFQPGDKTEYAQETYNDRKWKRIHVPGTWETQAYPDLDGWAWFRKTVQLPLTLKFDKVILVLGKIDANDEVYFNGIRIGHTGLFPSNDSDPKEEKWEKERFYYIPHHIIHWNSLNVIAVRVYDYNGSGGIYEGPVGITSQKALIEYKKYSRW